MTKLWLSVSCQAVLDAHSPLGHLQPRSGMIVAGPSLHHDLNALSYFTAGVKRPLCAIIGGSRLDEKIKMIDSVIDRVKTHTISHVPYSRLVA